MIRASETFLSAVIKFISSRSGVTSDAAEQLNGQKNTHSFKTSQNMLKILMSACVCATALYILIGDAHTGQTRSWQYYHINQQSLDLLNYVSICRLDRRYIGFDFTLLLLWEDIFHNLHTGDITFQHKHILNHEVGIDIVKRHFTFIKE